MTNEMPQELKYNRNWLSALDRRTNIAQDLQKRHTALCDDLGGYNVLSYQQKALVDRAIFLEFHLQQEEIKLAKGEDFDSGKWVQACNSLNGLFAKLGLHRQARELSLDEYLSHK